MKTTLTVAVWITLLALAFAGLTIHEGEFLILTATVRWRKRVTPADVIHFAKKEETPALLVN